MKGMVKITCKKCGIEDSVTAHQANVKKLLRCHSCLAKQATKRREERAKSGNRYVRDPVKSAAYEAARSKLPNVKARRAADAARSIRNPELRYRHEARWKVRREIASGRLERQACETCGDIKSQAHHDDYTKPLVVRWLCQRHHREWHRDNTPIYAHIGNSK